MDELQLIKEFRAAVPAAPDEARRAAHGALAARIERRRRWKPFAPRRPSLVFALVALVAALGAGSALAFGDDLIDLIRGKPAPESVKKDVEQWFGDEDTILPQLTRQPGVIASCAHGVAAVRMSVGVAALWGHGRARGASAGCSRFSTRVRADPASSAA